MSTVNVIPEGPVERDVVIEQDVTETPLGAVLREDPDVGGHDARAHKPAHVYVVTLSTESEIKIFLKINSYLHVCKFPGKCLKFIFL